MADDVDYSTTHDSLGETLAAAVAEHEAKAVSDASPAEPQPRDTARSSQSEDRSREVAEPSTRQDRRSSSDSAYERAERSDTRDRRQASAKTETEASEIPASWSAKDRDAFNKLSPEGRDLVLRQHQEHSNFRREYEPVNKVFEPYRNRKKAHGWTPHKLVEAWANVEKRLMEGDGVNVIVGLARAYNLDPGHIAQALGLHPHQQSNAQDLYRQLPPEAARRLQSIQARLDGEDRMRADTARRTQHENEQRIAAEIEKFKRTHEHFEELENDMTALAHAAIASRKPVPSLEQLYEAAMWSNPSTRDKALAARQRPQPAKAAGNARAAPGRPRGNGTERTLADEIAAAIGG